MTMVLACDGVVNLNNSGRPSCNTDFYLIDSATFMVNEALTSADILYLYTWGMGAILLPWSIAYAVKWAIKVINLA
jgi:hypothetical protein